jgi:sugar phosphate isomerase/epimerase
VEKTRESVRALAEFSKRYSVEIVVENLPANMNATCSTASELIEVLEGTDVRVCFDMGHANTASQIDELLELVGRFGNVHLHNNDGQWDQHNKVDDGSADIRKVVSVLKSSYGGNMIIESTDLQTGAESKSTLERLLG